MAKRIPRPAVAVPVPMPESISTKPNAVWFWEQHAPELIAAGYLRPHHAETFAMACELYSDSLRFKAMLDAEGDTVENSRGMKYPHPAVKMLRDARRDLARMATEFGLTALAGARIPKEVDSGEEDSNPLKAFGITG